MGWDGFEMPVTFISKQQEIRHDYHLFLCILVFLLSFILILHLQATISFIIHDATGQIDLPEMWRLFQQMASGKVTVEVVHVAYTRESLLSPLLITCNTLMCRIVCK